MAEKQTEYLIIETDDMSIGEGHSRGIIFIGEGNLSNWKEKLNGDPKKNKYYLTQLKINEENNEKKFETSRFVSKQSNLDGAQEPEHAPDFSPRVLDISKGYTLLSWDYRLLGDAFKSISMPLNKEISGLIKKILEE